jgi:hypothetical protein
MITGLALLGALMIGSGLVLGLVEILMCALESDDD